MKDYLTEISVLLNCRKDPFQASPCFHERKLLKQNLSPDTVSTTIIIGQEQIQYAENRFLI